MRRLAAVLLLCVFGALLPSAAVFALAAPQQILPICCRAHGAHACVMGSASVSTDAGATLRQLPCPFQGELRAVATVVLSLDLARGLGLGLAASGVTWTCLAFSLAAHFLRRSAPRGPPSYLSV